MNKPLSISSINAFRQCPFSFWAIYVENLRPQYQSPESRRGSIIHKMIADHGKWRFLHSELEKVYIIRAWEEAKKNALANTLPDDEGELSLLFGKVEEIYGAPPDFFPATYEQRYIEERFYFDQEGYFLSGENGAYFAGSPDLLLLNGDIGLVRDYKSGRIIDPIDYQLESDLQLRFYAHIAARIFPNAIKIRLEKVFLRFPNYNQALEMPTHEFSGVFDEMRSLASPIFEALAKIDFRENPINIFPARPNHNCAWCAVRAHCPEWRNLPALVDSFDKLDLAQAAQAARMIQKAEGRIAELKDQLRSYIFFNGPLEEGGETLDLWPVNQRQINTVDAIHLLRKIGFPDDSIFGKLKITIADYESFGKGDKNNKERLKALITNKPITKMEWRKS